MAGKTASVKVYRPAHVPTELLSVWTAAAQRCASKGNLLKPVRVASGEVKSAVDYEAVNRSYKRILTACIDLAEKAEEEDEG